MNHRRLRVPGALALFASLVAAVGGCGGAADDDVTFSGPKGPSPDVDMGYEGRSFDAWVARLEAKDAADRYAALVALAEFPEATTRLEGIEARLADEVASVRWAALECLGRAGPAAGGASDAVVARLADPDRGVRRAAARAAGRLGSAAAPALLARWAGSEDEPRALAKAALLTIGAGLEPEVGSIGRQLSGDDPTLAEDAADLLAAAGEPGAKELARALDDERSLTVVTAAAALGRMGAAGAQAVPALERTSARTGFVREAVLDALKGLGEAGQKALERLAASPDADLAAAAKDRLAPR